MKLKPPIIWLLLLNLSYTFSLQAQTITKEELTFLTSEWKGQRFSEGRPKISDELLIRAKNIGIDDAWTVLKNLGYTNQFEPGLKMVNHVPVIGRTLTAMFMPSRPDIEKI